MAVPGVIVDAGFLVALVRRDDSHNPWAALQARRLPPPWRTCEAVLSEAFYLAGTRGSVALDALLQRGACVLPFRLSDDLESVLRLMRKYAQVPMSLADACLVRMTETAGDVQLLTTDADFRIYRRHGRQAIPCLLPR
ncbi:MAG TPA: PIN domain-containing protein [Methylomirabilota bacterium]|nr:PIN domain-containing protein [Methylomirabilota bacterium]